jgi:hypothetical protein
LWLKSESAEPVIVEIGGLDAERNFISETLALKPLERALAQNDYYSLAYIHSESLPAARVGVQSTARKAVYLVQPHDWVNIWVYGMEIWLAGFLPENEFRSKANDIFAGSSVLQYSKTQIKSLSVPVSDLRPLETLFEQVKNWELEKKSW